MWAICRISIIYATSVAIQKWPLSVVDLFSKCRHLVHCKSSLPDCIKGALHSLSWWSCISCISWWTTLPVHFTNVKPTAAGSSFRGRHAMPGCVYYFQKPQWFPVGVARQVNKLVYLMVDEEQQSWTRRNDRRNSHSWAMEINQLLDERRHALSLQNIVALTSDAFHDIWCPRFQDLLWLQDRHLVV